jgi:hypothetical protein
MSNICNAMGNQVTETAWSSSAVHWLPKHAMISLTACTYCPTMLTLVNTPLTTLTASCKTLPTPAYYPLGPWTDQSTMKWNYSQWKDALDVQSVTHKISSLGNAVLPSTLLSLLSTTLSRSYFDLFWPNWYGAQIPMQASPANVFGTNIVTTSHASHQWPSITGPLQLLFNGDNTFLQRNTNSSTLSAISSWMQKFKFTNI